jgi:HAMP domain-containing protein/signal transduction histidine kinase/ActR/RegA family two-component response regulator
MAPVQARQRPADASLQQLLDGLTAVRGGDFNTRLPVSSDPLMGEIVSVFNAMSDQLALFTSEVTRVAREVGTDGKLGGQAQVPGVTGTWKDLTDSVNAMAGNLTGQVRDIAEVATAVARGDLSQKITVNAKGELLELKNTLNTMVDQLSSFADEVTRVAREVGTEGRLGGQASVPGVGGTWRDLTDSVNFMAGNLTSQVRNIAQVTTATAKGDLSQKITVDARGEILELKNTVNTMVDQLSAFAGEVTRVAREVGTEGKLGGQAQVPGVGGTWRDLTDSVNFMAGNLTGQVRSIAQVAGAVADGDLSQKITVDARGEILELKETINTMVDRLSSFAGEVTRMAREVGTEGKLGGQADVQDVSGTWRDLTESVNVMATNLTDQVRNIAQVTTAVAKGDLSQKIRVDARGEILELKETINTMVDQLSAFAGEVTRVARDVGTQGKLGGQASVQGVSGTWEDLTDNVNVMASNLTAQVRSIAQVATAVARGDLSQRIRVEAKGEVAALAETINGMVDTLSAFAGEVTRVAREVGTEGILGGQAAVPNVAGTWKDLTDNVNSMANNLTSQVRNIAQVTTAVAQGDLSRKIDVDARGEILELKTTINTMVDQLSAFAAEVTRVAREVGSQGRLGGQAEVEGVSGTWKRLTENVNELAGNLTRQVRAIAEVTSAVARGDLTRSIAVEAQGEVAKLKDNINAMVESLRETTRANQEQDWLQTNLARVAGLMQGHRDLAVVAERIMEELIPLVGAQQGTFFLADNDTRETRLRLIAGYGLRADKDAPGQFGLGQSLIGQAAKTRKPIVLGEIPEDYLRISSGLGDSAPANLVIMPIVFEDQVLGVIEAASFARFTQVHRDFLEQLMETIGVNVNAIIANARTDALLAESQRLAAELQARSGELQARQDELQRSNADLEDKAAQLARQNRDIEQKNAQIEQARQEIEERARQLDLASRYKSQFLANMSHELRTPLNSLLVLARLLAQNPEANLTGKQVEYANVIHSSGSDLLQLINDILDLSKVEAGKMDIQPERFALSTLAEDLHSVFGPLTAEKGLEFTIEPAEGTPAELVTDWQRLRQILHNLLSNAVKFSEHGHVRLSIEPAQPRGPGGGDAVLFSVTDSGIGISAENLASIFSAFQQGDGTTSRRYGGTGLGLAICREVAAQLGGDITVRSEPGSGSTFSLYLPMSEEEAGPTAAEPPAADRQVGAQQDGALESPSAQLPAAAADAHERLRGRKVLIVDDDPRNAFVLTDALELYGMTVVRAADGRQAIRELGDGDGGIDVVLMDIMMPQMDGYETTRAIRQIPHLAQLPVIAVTARAMHGDREKSIAAGATDHVTKPVDIDDLLACIERWLAPAVPGTGRP